MDTKKYDDVLANFKMLNYEIPIGLEDATLSFFSESRAEIRDLIEKLSWDQPESVQENAISSLVKELHPWEYIYLVLPERYTVHTEIVQTEKTPIKGRWENAAKTIVQIGWPKVDIIMIPLFYWLLDPNWPGSERIREFLLSLPLEVLRTKMQEVLDHPERYHSCDYNDLRLLISEMCEDLNIEL